MVGLHRVHHVDRYYTLARCIGNELLYKVDNLLIFVQTIYYFAYAQNLVGRLLSQFYFGWSFAHARFLPNLFNNIIPPRYL